MCPIAKKRERATWTGSNLPRVTAQSQPSTSTVSVNPREAYCKSIITPAQFEVSGKDGARLASSSRPRLLHVVEQRPHDENRAEEKDESEARSTDYFRRRRGVRSVQKHRGIRYTRVPYPTRVSNNQKKNRIRM